MKFRYFANGEYGGKFGRPHYHILFFGQDWLERSQKLGTEGAYYTNRFLTEVWGNGHVTIAPLDPPAAFYVAGYSLKNTGSPDVFNLQSKRPYIGHGWLEKYHDDIARNGFVTIEGRKFPIPTTYLKRREHASAFEPLLDKRAEHFRTASPDEAANRRDALRAREANLQARVNL